MKKKLAAMFAALSLVVVGMPGYAEDTIENIDMTVKENTKC